MKWNDGEERREYNDNKDDERNGEGAANEGKEVETEYM